jgi:hypothetical protein
LVSRLRLIERLHAGLRGKLTLVSAPTGYGKTTLVSDWIARSEIPAAWLSLDASDNDVARFYSYLIAALQQIDPGIGAAVQPIFEANTDLSLEIEPLLTALVNDIAATGGRFALILDDYHLINEWKIHQSLDFMLDHLPSGMHVVLISRADPPMPLGRLRVQRQLTEIREVDLRFTADEAAAFLNGLMGLGLSGAEIESLEARTEGWIAGGLYRKSPPPDRVPGTRSDGPPDGRGADVSAPYLDPGSVQRITMRRNPGRRTKDKRPGSRQFILRRSSFVPERRAPRAPRTRQPLSRSARWRTPVVPLSPPLC